MSEMDPIVKALYRFILGSKNKSIMMKKEWHMCMRAAVDAHIERLVSTSEKRKAIVDKLVEMLMKEKE